MLYDRGIVQRDRPRYAIERSGSSYALHAGEINGINTGVTAAYADRNTSSSGGSSLGHLVVDKAGQLARIASDAVDSLGPKPGYSHAAAPTHTTGRYHYYHRTIDEHGSFCSCIV